MPGHVDDIRALTFDFYGTLVYPRGGKGRGARLVEYLDQQGLRSDPWEHQALYDVFGAYGHRYSPWFSPTEQAAFEIALARHVFERLRVQAPASAVKAHAEALWTILGPAAFAVFPDVAGVLAALERAGYPLVIISNWQAGLAGFCDAFGLGHAFAHVLASAEVGVAKPEPGIFLEAARRLDREPREILHVGDTQSDDYEGATAAGFDALLLARDAHVRPANVETIETLDEVITRLGLH
jgi:putative hydrolase of the HAD superfamily